MRSGILDIMLYPIGAKIDLRYLNEKPEAEPETPTEPTLYTPGTTLSFVKLAHGLILTKITEPSFAVSVAVGV